MCGLTSRCWCLQDRNPHRAGGGWSCGHEDAPLLSLRRHCLHCLSSRIHRTAWVVLRIAQLPNVILTFFFRIELIIVTADNTNCLYTAPSSLFQRSRFTSRAPPGLCWSRPRGASSSCRAARWTFTGYGNTLSVVYSVLAWTGPSTLNPRPAGGGGAKPPCSFPQIAPEVLEISLWNLPYLSGQRFHTLCQQIRTQVIIGEPWVTSEWRHVSPILTNKMGLRESPPLVQF